MVLLSATSTRIRRVGWVARISAPNSLKTPGSLQLKVGGAWHRFGCTKNTESGQLDRDGPSTKGGGTLGQVHKARFPSEHLVYHPPSHKSRGVRIADQRLPAQPAFLY